MKIAKALNKCSQCHGGISKGDKYIQFYGLDYTKHFVKRAGKVVHVPFNTRFKICRDCSPTLLKVSPSKYFEKRVILLIYEMVYYRNRFVILKEKNILFEFLKSKGIKISTTCPRCYGQGKIKNNVCDFPGCNNGSLVCGY